MSARTTLEFHDDGTILYEHRASKNSDERRTEFRSALEPMDVLTIPVLGGSDTTVTHHVLVMTRDTHDELKQRIRNWEGIGYGGIGYGVWDESDTTTERTAQDD